MEEKKKKTIYFVIDASGSMRGARRDAVNEAMETVMKALDDARREKESDFAINFAVSTFKGSNNIDWVVSKTSLDEALLVWQPFSSTYFYGETHTGKAIEAVIEEEEKGVYGEIDPEALPPVIVLISDGLPNGDNPTYEEVLERTEKNHEKFSRNFKYSTRIAIGINVDDEGERSLKKFGRLSGSLEKLGLKSYYSCDDTTLSTDLPLILKAITEGLTQKQ